MHLVTLVVQLCLLWCGFADDPTFVEVDGGNLNVRAVYGPGMPVPEFDASYGPGSRMYAATTYDPVENWIWLYGGYGRDKTDWPDTLSDTWAYDIDLGNWAYVNGDQDHDDPSVFKPKGHHAVCRKADDCGNGGVKPGGKEGAFLWWKDVDTMYLFGGFGYGDPKTTRITRPTLWFWDYTGNQKWMVDCLGRAAADCGERFVEVDAVTLADTIYPIEFPLIVDDWPPGRAHMIALITPASNLLVIGGFHDTRTDLNDVWEFNYLTGWTIKQPTLFDELYPCGQQVITGSLGAYDAGNIPGSRSQAVYWLIESTNEVYIFGGYDSCVGAYWADLWKYHILNNEFAILTDTSITGSLLYQKRASYLDGQGQYGSGNRPGARGAGIGFILNDEPGHPYLATFGGVGLMANGPGFLNDLWVYDTLTGNWSATSSLRYVNDFGVANQFPSSRYGSTCIQTSTAWDQFDNMKVLFYGGQTYRNFEIDHVDEIWEIDYTYECAGEKSWKPGLCSGHGWCVGDNTCECHYAWMGTVCDEAKTVCNGHFYDSPQVCSNMKGECVSDQVCECYHDLGYFGYWCEESILRAYVPEDKGDTLLYVDWVVKFSEIGYPGTKVVDCYSVVENADVLGVGAVCQWEAYTLSSTLYSQTDILNVTLNLALNETLHGFNLTLIPQAASAHPGVTIELPILGFGGGGTIDVPVITPPDTDMFPLFVGLGAGLGVFAICVIIVAIVTCIWCCVGLRILRKTRQLKHLELLALEVELHRGTVEKLDIDDSLFTIDYQDLVLEKIISSSSGTAVVYRATWKGRLVCFKCYKTSAIASQDHMDDFEKEVNMLSSMRHPNILTYFGCVFDPPHVGIITEFCTSGDVRNYIQTQDVRISNKLRILSEVASAMGYLNQRGIVHRDLKGDNILLTEELTAKLIDFGLSRVVEGATSLYLTKQAGTSQYMAPEVTLSSRYGKKCDVFSFGIIMFEVLTEDFEPYGKMTELDFNVELRVALNPSYRPKIGEHAISGAPCLAWYVKMMKNCWDVDVDLRPTFEEIVERILEKRGETSRRYDKESMLIDDPIALRAAREEGDDSASSSSSDEGQKTQATSKESETQKAADLADIDDALKLDLDLDL